MFPKHSQVKDLPTPEYSEQKGMEKQLQGHLQKLKKKYTNKEHKKLLTKAKERWETELMDFYATSGFDSTANKTESSESEKSEVPLKETRQMKRQKRKQLEKDSMLNEIKSEKSISIKDKEMDELAVVFQKHGLQLELMEEIPGDGDCLFTAVSHELNKIAIKIESNALRSKVVDYMEENINEFEPFYCEPIPFADYLKDMRHHSWGGHLELIAISKLYNVNIDIYSVDGLNKIATDFTKGIKLIYLKHFLALGEHYNAFK